MVQICGHCSRSNPSAALYCHHDGSALAGRGQQASLHSGSQPFLAPFVFPGGKICHNFDELSLACRQQWSEALTLLKLGYLENFLSGMARADLAASARAAAQNPDGDRGLDQLLERLPSQVLKPPKLSVTPREINLGRMSVGQDRKLDLQIINEGMRLLHGSVTCDNTFWLSLGNAGVLQGKSFQTVDGLTVPLHVRGHQLRAGTKPLETNLVIESNGGNALVKVRVDVPITPFPEGVLAGAMTPREIAQKAKKSPKEAGLLFESGAVARWFQLNGWTYPVQGPIAFGLGAVQQFFEALGLTKPPLVTISNHAVNLTGDPGDRLEHAVELSTTENRPIYASAFSDRPWLTIGPTWVNGNRARISLLIPKVPPCPGGVLRAQVIVTANGQQRFFVSVILTVTGDPEDASEILDVLPVLDDDIPTVELV